MAHISDKMLQAYVSSRLPRKEERSIMEHIAMCDSCAHRFAAHMEKGILVSPPPDLKQEILEKTIVNRKSSVFMMKELSERKNRQRGELLAYSMRVVFAMAASIMILFTMSFQDDAGKLPEEIMQVQEKTVFVFTEDGIVRKRASEKASEEAEEKKDTGREQNKKLTDSLQEVSGAFGNAWSGFWERLRQ